MQTENKNGFWGSILGFLNRYKFEFIVMVFVYVYLTPVLGSGFLYDDSFNSLIHGAAVNGGVSINDLVAGNEQYWFDQGRVFPMGPLILFLFNALALTANASFYYKLYIVLMTLVNVWLCGVLVEEITHSKRLKLLVMLILPIFFQIAVSTFNALYSFHSLAQNVMFFGILSLLFTIYSFEKNKKRYIVLSAVFMACSMLFYEVGFLFIFVIMIIAFMNTDRKFTARLKMIIPQLVVFAVIFILNVYARMTAEAATYAGVDLHITDLMAIVKTFAKQFSAAVPLTQAYFGGVDMRGTLLSFDLRHLICLPIFAVLSYFIFFRIKKDEDQEKLKSNVLIMLIGAVFVIIPCALISISARYQTSDVHLGAGHLPVYVEWLGIALITAGLASILSQKKRLKLIIFHLCILLGLPILTININTMDDFFTYMNLHTVVAREAYVSAIKDGFYDEINETSSVLYDNSPQFYAVPNGDLFATYADRKMAAQDFYAYIDSLPPDAKEFSELADVGAGTRFTKEIYYGAGGGIILKGSLGGVRVDAVDSAKKKILISDAQLYVDMPNDVRTMTIQYNKYSDKDQFTHKSVSFDLNVVAEEGHIVYLDSDGWIDVNSITIE